MQQITRLDIVANSMTTSHKLLLSTLLGSLLTGAYWIAFFAVAYALTAGDYRPGAGPSDSRGVTTAWLVWIIGFGIYAVLAWVWRRIDFRLAGRERR